MAFECVEICGFDIAVATQSEIVDYIVDQARSAKGGWLITVNSDHLRQCQSDLGVRDLLMDSDVLVADGMPLVWASCLRGKSLPERVAGSDLIWSLSMAASIANLPIFLLGGDDGVAEGASVVLKEKIPELSISGVYCPPFGFENSEFELSRIRGEIISAGCTAICFVALSFPRQDYLIQKLRSDFAGVWFIGVGISFSYISGAVPRAPLWMRRIGLEWLHRLVFDFRRLFFRYVWFGIPFVLGLLLSSVRSRLMVSRDV